MYKEFQWTYTVFAYNEKFVGTLMNVCLYLDFYVHRYKSNLWLKRLVKISVLSLSIVVNGKSQLLFQISLVHIFSIQRTVSINLPFWKVSSLVFINIDFKIFFILYICHYFIYLQSDYIQYKMENLAASNWTIILEMDKRFIKIWCLRCKSTDLQ